MSIVNNILCNNVSELVNSEPGFFLGLHFQHDELALIREHVKAQWIDVIKKHAPQHVAKFQESGIENYHLFSHLLDHRSIWEKNNRILPQNATNSIRKTSLFKSLEEIYGLLEITDEENVGREEFYWRLVRPNESSDMGPLHADAWFWELGHGTMPENRERVKVWIALYCEPGLNGLRVVPHSHKKEWKYHGEYRDGFSKPQIDENEDQLKPELIYTKPGDAIVFHDRLLHGGAPNRGKYTRVSLEFTMLIKK